MQSKRTYRRIHYRIRRKIFPDGVIRNTNETGDVIVETKTQPKVVEEKSDLEKLSEVILDPVKRKMRIRPRANRKKEYLSNNILQEIRSSVIELLNKLNMTFKKTYYYNGDSKQYVKFYKIDNKGKNTLSELMEKLQKTNHVVASEIKTNCNNEVSIFVYNRLGNIVEPKIEFKKEENMTKEHYWPLGVQKGKDEKELISLLDEKGGASKIDKSIIEDFMPDEVIKGVVDHNKNYYPIAINIGGERKIKWKTATK